MGDIWFKYVIIGAFLGLCDKKGHFEARMSRDP